MQIRISTQIKFICIYIIEAFMIEDLPKSRSEQSTNYNNNELQVFVTIEQSNNREIIMGNINIIPKTSIRIPPMIVTIRGLYIVSSYDQFLTESDSSEQKYQIQDTVVEIMTPDNRQGNRKKQQKIESSNNEVREVFLEGRKCIGQEKEIEIRKKGKKVNYPFSFTVPSNLPPSINSIFFANKNIQIKYLISIQTQQSKKQEEGIFSPFQFQFPISLLQNESSLIKESRLVNSLSYFCFTKYCCKCLGTYHIEFVATILSAGNLQVECRIYREDNDTLNFFKKIAVQLCGELKKTKKMIIGKKQFHLNRNEFGMLEGEVLFEYEPSLKTYKNNLFTINFWLETEIEFEETIWKIKRKNKVSDIIL